MLAPNKGKGIRLLPDFLQAALSNTSDSHPVVHVPLSTILIDERDELILPGNVRVPHVTGHGYQRDPYERKNWITKHAAKYREDLFRPIEVSVRETAVTYERDGQVYEACLAAIDGGGRTLMREIKAQLDGVPLDAVRVPVRLHFDLSRADEADAFVSFDQETYHLRQAQKFVAMLGAGHPLALGIDKAMKPFYVATAGKGSLTCASHLIDIYLSGVATDYTHLLRDTARVASKWIGFTRGKWTGSRAHLTGIQFGAVALVVSAIENYNEPVQKAVTEILEHKSYTPGKMQAKAETSQSAEKLKPTSAEKTRAIAGALARAINKKIENAVDINVINNGDLYERFDARGSFHAKVTAWDVANGIGDDDNDED